MKKITQQKLPAFTLQELLIVLVIVGILVLLALPNLMPLISKAKSTEAKIQLEHLHSLQKAYFYEHSKYASTINDIDFIQEKLVSEGEDGRAQYRVEIVQADNAGFLARATAVTDFDGDGIFNVWEVDHNKNLRETIKD